MFSMGTVEKRFTQKLFSSNSNYTSETLWYEIQFIEQITTVNEYYFLSVIQASCEWLSSVLISEMKWKLRFTIYIFLMKILEYIIFNGKQIGTCMQGSHACMLSLMFWDVPNYGIVLRVFLLYHFKVFTTTLSSILWRVHHIVFVGLALAH